MKKILITSGSTSMKIDTVRTISNIFKGTTGALIANKAAEKDNVTLLANKNVYPILNKYGLRNNFQIIEYSTFEELEEIMEYQIKNNDFDIIIHSAAVSDYKVSAICNNIHDLANQAMIIENGGEANGSYNGKISSGKNLYMALTPTKKLIDQIRTPWGFNGMLVKFKLQVGISEEELITIAQNSLEQSNANIIVANCLESFNNWEDNNLFIIDSFGNKINTSRTFLAEKLLDSIESYMYKLLRKHNNV